MAALWPAFLQDKLNEASFSYDFGGTVLKSQNSTGPVKRRRLYTKGVDMVKCSINIKYDEFEDFYDFWDIDLNGGATSFLFDHPFTGEEEEFLMDEPPRIVPIGGEYFTVNMTWEKVP